MFLSYTGSAFAQTTIFPSSTTINFQTSGRERPPSIGDWYTTLPSASTQRFHRFVVTITNADLRAAGGVVLLSVLDAESNGALDEVDGLPIGAAGVSDPTRFRLLNPDGSIRQTIDVPPTAPDGTNISFSAITAPGSYEIQSVTGGFPISGDATGTNALLDTDGDGRVDTGILQPNESRQFTLCVTRNPGAPAQYLPAIRATSAVDRRVREQAIAAGVPPEPVETELLQTTFVFDASAPALRLVKRITNITRNGTMVRNGMQFLMQ